MRSPIVEVLYFEGCPNHHEARERVEVIAADEGLEPELRQVEVTSAEEAERLRFLGSPTIRVDGCDVEPRAGERDTFALACRVYRTESGLSGRPPDEWIRAALTASSMR